MKDSEKIDFNPLDPSKDEARWRLLVAETSRRARELRVRAPTVSGQLVAWGRANSRHRSRACLGRRERVVVGATQDDETEHGDGSNRASRFAFAMRLGRRGTAARGVVAGDGRQ